MKTNERVKIINKNNTVQNSEGKSVAFGYRIQKNELGNNIVRSDGVHMLESVGGILCGETGYINGPIIQTVFGCLKDSTVGRDTTNSLSGQETTAMAPIFLDRYQTTVYVHISNISYT